MPRVRTPIVTFLLFLPAFILSINLSCETSRAEALTLKFGHVDAPGALTSLTIDEFAKRVNERLRGRAKIEVYGQSQLGDDLALLEKLKTGEVTFSLPQSVMSSVSDEFGVFEMPFLVLTRTHVEKVRGQLLKAYLQPAVKAKGYRILAVWELGFRHITNNVRPIEKPDDLKGVALRVPQGNWRIKVFKSFGANPVPLSYGKVYDALKAGEIQGQENPLTQINSAKFYEVQKYMSLTGHVYSPAFLLVSEEQFSKLPREVQRAIEKTAKDMEDWVTKTAVQQEKELLASLKDRIQINEAEKLAFVLASQPIYQEFAKTVPHGKEMIRVLYDKARFEEQNQ
jgi:tripartite ATP-independent transporter DctP family solute receptor